MTEKLKEIFETTTKKKLPDINESSSLSADLGLNSFELFDIVCAIEDEFGVSISDRDLMKMVTVGDLVSFIEKNA
ncbi:MAG: acyl carrier protein [Acutalibacteraceae bacterium]